MNRIKNLIKDDLERVEAELSSVLDKENSVIESIDSFINNSSKRIRSVLAVLYLKSNDVTISDNTIKLIAAGEIVHNASLLHDDVIDSAKIRRGNMTISEEFSPKISILSGDLLVSKAVKLILDIDNQEIVKSFIECTEEMSRAEIRQFLLRDKLPKQEEYLSIAKGKTANLFKTIVGSSAVLNGLDVKTAKVFSEKFGLVFQIKNDLEPNSAQNDKLNKIHTLKDIIGIEKTNSLIDNYKEQMNHIVKEFPQNQYAKGLESLVESL